MARKPKNPKFAAFDSYPNCFDFNKKHLGFFDYLESDGPYVVELGCARAELSLALAKQHPDLNYIGVDYKSDRMWRPAQMALNNKMSNCAFIRVHAQYLEEVFKPQSISELWITFPDPYPRLKHAKHRLTHPNFLNMYSRLLCSDGVIHFKTDNQKLFDWSIEEVAASQFFTPLLICRDLHSESNAAYIDAQNKTAYERKYLAEGRTIYYAQFALRN